MRNFQQKICIILTYVHKLVPLYQLNLFNYCKKTTFSHKSFYA